ncbi:MAG: OB-fold domain-containing protein [Pseudomonadota bacterium]
MTDYARPLPKVTDETMPFWEGCKSHELKIQRCASCAQFRFPPQKMCRHCNSVEAHWDAVSGRGSVYSFTIPSQPSPGELPARGFDYPFAVVLVELEGTGGIRIASNMVECSIEDIEIGMPVEVAFEQVTEEVTLPKFRPA